MVRTDHRNHDKINNNAKCGLRNDGQRSKSATSAAPGLPPKHHTKKGQSTTQSSNAYRGAPPHSNSIVECKCKLLFSLYHRTPNNKCIISNRFGSELSNCENAGRHKK